MSSSRNTSGSQRRGRQSSGEARTTTDGEQLVKDIICGRIRIIWWKLGGVIGLRNMEELKEDYPCNQVDLLTTSQNHFQSVGMGGSTAIGANTGGGYMSFLGVHSTELEEPRREPTSFVNLLNESNDDGLV
ncbi:BnaA09g54390D [Brassica napus]|uniref:BnaA09g54390D protein n=1 Tax=Brassica napus TaxID=3708 RepID=A0A078JJV4_BRANA|nr:BnaA09g54390D [Brassica napus]